MYKYTGCSVIVTESLLNVTLCFPGSLVSRVSGCGLCFLCWTDYLDFDLCLADNEIWITPINILLLDLPVCVRVVTEGLRHAQIQRCGISYPFPIHHGGAEG